MLRVVLVTAALTAALAAPALAQSRDRGFGRSADAWCNDGSSGDRASHCEVRDATIAGNNPLDIDAGQNGGIRVRGSDRSDVLVRAKIVGYADTEADARRVVSGVRVDTAGGRVRAREHLRQHWPSLLPLLGPLCARSVAAAATLVGSMHAYGR